MCLEILPVLLCEIGQILHVLVRGVVRLEKLEHVLNGEIDVVQNAPDMLILGGKVDTGVPKGLLQ